MKKEIKLKNKKVEYQIRRSKRAKRLRLTVYCDGNFVVTVPKGLNMESVESYILKKTEWILRKLRIMKTRSNSFVVKMKNEKEYEKLKKEAFNLACRKVEKFNKIYGFNYNKVIIKNQKTRWGSCSKKGNLNYNYKIALLPDKLVDYIIVHELCHLKEFNHSKKFWSLVEKGLPDYKERIDGIKGTID